MTKYGFSPPNPRPPLKSRKQIFFIDFSKLLISFSSRQNWAEVKNLTTKVLNKNKKSINSCVNVEHKWGIMKNAFVKNEDRDSVGFAKCCSIH